MKLCKNCKWLVRTCDLFRHRDLWFNLRCHSPNNMKEPDREPVMGTAKRDSQYYFSYCSDARAEGGIVHRCGRNGNWFEEKGND